MKNRINAFLALMIGLVISVQAQQQTEMDSTTGKMIASKTKTFTFKKEGKSVPYQVTVIENRTYTASFDESDEGKNNNEKEFLNRNLTKKTEASKKR